MKKKTFVKKELIQELQVKYPKIPNTDIERMVESVFRYLSNQLASSNNIEIRGFGMLKVKTMKARIARNPKSGAKVEVPSKNKISWKSSKLLNVAINQEGGGN
jgi:integration host factor subunit beta